jgi:hypothetical protein
LPVSFKSGCPFGRFFAGHGAARSDESLNDRLPIPTNSCPMASSTGAVFLQALTMRANSGPMASWMERDIFIGQ